MADIVLTGDTSGAITVAAPAVAGTNTLTLPASTGTIITDTAPKAGNIIQVVQNTKTDKFSTTTVLTSTTEITGANATITPSASSSKVLVMISGAFGVSTNNYGVALQLKRGTTLISVGDLRGSETRASAGSPVDGSGWAQNFNITFLDSPSTTSATTYKLFLGVESGATASIGGSYASGGTYNMSIPTNIVLMEVAA